MDKLDPLWMNMLIEFEMKNSKSCLAELHLLRTSQAIPFIPFESSHDGHEWKMYGKISGGHVVWICLYAMFLLTKIRMKSDGCSGVADVLLRNYICLNPSCLNGLIIHNNAKECAVPTWNETTQLIYSYFIRLGSRCFNYGG